MSVTADDTGTSWNTAWRSRAVRRFGCTTLLLAALVAGLSATVPLEHAFWSGPGISDSPFSSLVLILGLPHFLIGFLFMVTSKDTRGRIAWLAVAISVLIGVGLCVLLAHYGALTQHGRLGETLIGLYFFIHVYLDEWQFYRRDGGGSSRSNVRQMMLLILSLIAGFEALIWSRQVLIGDPLYNLRHYLDPSSIEGMSRAALWLMVGAPAMIIATLSYRSATARAGGGILDLLRRDTPLWCVYGLIFVIFALSTVVGGKLSTIVLIHLIAWWIFVTANLAGRRRQQPTTRAHPWEWVRTTQLGFQLFHGALVATFLVLLLLYTHDEGHLRGGVFDYALTQTAFYYWTVMHVTISLFPPVIRRLRGWNATIS